MTHLNLEQANQIIEGDRANNRNPHLTMGKDGKAKIEKPNTNFVGAKLAKNKDILKLAKKINKVWKEEVSDTGYDNSPSSC